MLRNFDQHTLLVSDGPVGIPSKREPIEAPCNAELRIASQNLGVRVTKSPEYEIGVFTCKCSKPFFRILCRPVESPRAFRRYRPDFVCSRRLMVLSQLS